VQNPDNSGYSSIYRNNLAKIFDFVAAGGILVFHDRHVTTAASVLPGSPGTFVRTLGTNIDILNATTLVTNGPGGVLTSNSLDGGNFSHHGFVQAAGTPAGAAGILSTGNAAQWVLYSYPFGAGAVVYSSIPLDFYLAGFGPAQVSQNFRTIYAPNVLAYASGLR
ncbi:MAG: hypothetical protein ACREN5_11160, partial [Gemmatimonadales bacterium]